MPFAQGRPDCSAKVADGVDVRVILHIARKDDRVFCSMCGGRVRGLGGKWNRVRIHADARARCNRAHYGGITLRSGKNRRISGQQSVLQPASGTMKDAMHHTYYAGFDLGTAQVKHTFDVVQVEHGARAGSDDAIVIGCAPEVLDDADLVAGTRDRPADLGAETSKAVDQWRHVAGGPGGVAHRLRGEGAAVRGKLDHCDSLHRRWK